MGCGPPRPSPLGTPRPLGPLGQDSINRQGNNNSPTLLKAKDVGYFFPNIKGEGVIIY